METWATDALEMLLNHEMVDIQVQARQLLDLIYGSANATPGPDTGRNTPV